MDPVGRLFLCGRCRAQVVICSRCDRGQIYCGAACSQAARKESQRAAGRRYQQGRRGRFAHAGRARRHRQRRRQKNNVTHQGSPAPPPDGLLAADSTAAARQPQQTPPRILPVAARHCHFCGCLCAEAVRFGFLPRRVPPTDNPKRNST
ncbi:hypothetical protein [uncultured Thiodictyon sp.]|uniref:hypothetical protein n=1 Tax=uncultured Thiodictyon sp. TaxID=1846217 RepID=UPI0025E4655B|nr:hypothetical protein [uncultured Thiodictyon sp.]